MSPSTGLIFSHNELHLMQTDDDKQWSWQEVALMLTSDSSGKPTAGDEVTKGLIYQHCHC